MLGIVILQTLDGAAKLNKNIHNNALQFEGLKVYMDGDNECSIAVGYNPFLTKQSLILT